MPKSTPVVFISSTFEDLKEYRAAVRDALLACKFHPEMQEYFESAPHPPLQECLHKVDGADRVIAIVAHRYGWIPEDQPAGQRKSITWLECERAGAGRVMAFVVEDKAHWPADRRDSHELLEAMQEGRATEALFKSVNERASLLKEFRSWLGKGATWNTFSDPGTLRQAVSESLFAWYRRENPEALDPPSDPARYLQSLFLNTARIEPRGLNVATGRAHIFPIEEFFIALTTTGEPGGRLSKHASRDELSRWTIPLDDTLHATPAVILGDPGAGKSTFLRRVAHDLSGKRLADTSASFPVLIRLSDFDAFVREKRVADTAPSEIPAGWLTQYLDEASVKNDWRLGKDFFSRTLEAGPGTILLDGLDEGPDEASRERLAHWIERLPGHYPNCSIVATSRPAAYTGEVVLHGFTHFRIDPLSPEAIRQFLQTWCNALYAPDTAAAEAHFQELSGALAQRPDIAKLAENAVMLTAIAVLHWNELRLPEQRTDLYDSIVKWLSRQRERRPGRTTPTQCVALLRELALAMQDHPEGRLTQMGRRSAAAAIAPHFGDDPAAALDAATVFLEQEERDSGIIVTRGGKVTFWHLTFQEFLAALALSARLEEPRRALLFNKQRPEKIYQPEWREVLLLFAGLLEGRGRDQTDGLVSSIIDDVEDQAFPRIAAAVGLVGEIVRDLRPAGYTVRDDRFPDLARKVLGIFERDASRNVPVETRIAAAEALPFAGDPRLDYWVEIPAGEFRMGSQRGDGDAASDEFPAHPVTLDAYRIARYPVTVREFQKFLQVTSHPEPPRYGSELARCHGLLCLGRLSSAHRSGMGAGSQGSAVAAVCLGLRRSRAEPLEF